MSTRSQIRFKEKGQPTTQLYRHSDGYPEGVIKDLKQFLTWYMSEPTARQGDPSYAGADFIYYMKERMPNKYKKEGWDKIGYGVENRGGIHGDEEYLYIIKFPEMDYINDRQKLKDAEIEVKIYDAMQTKEGKSPSDENLTFTDRKLLFDGTLEQAYQKYVLEEQKERERMKAR